jgi:1-aminocyclopropane-1-carboxylate deaminase/D-cysteine desulfhydrase-like pyridoxal-dependent ACC family enzyme
MNQQPELEAKIALTREAIGRLPRVSLATTPTPLEDAPRLTQELGGPRVLIKRDDLTGLALGGNKARMLEFVLARALADDADTVVGGSAVQSNYSRQLAAGCAKLGLDCHLVLRRTRPNDLEITGALLIDLLLGANVEFVENDRALQAARQLELAAELEKRGRRVFLAPVASNSHQALHSVAYVEAWLEFRDQYLALGVHPTHVYVCSLDTTHAGLILGRSISQTKIRIVAVTPNERSIYPDTTIEREVSQLARETADLLGVEASLPETAPEVVDGYVGMGYGVVTEDGISASRLFASAEALLVDPVYTAKAAAALVADARSKRLTSEDTVVFWHTGGVSALFAYADELDLTI